MIIFFILSQPDADKLDLLFRRYEKPLARYIYSIIKDPALGDDTFQAMFIKVISNIEKIGEVESKETKNYLYKIAKTTAIDFYNKRKSEQAVTNAYDEMVINSVDEFHATEIIGRADVNDRLELCILQMSEADRDIISMKYGMDLEDWEIAKHYGINEEAVRKRISRARKRLADLLEIQGKEACV